MTTATVENGIISLPFSCLENINATNKSTKVNIYKDGYGKLVIENPSIRALHSLKEEMVEEQEKSGFLTQTDINNLVNDVRAQNHANSS